MPKAKKNIYKFTYQIQCINCPTIDRLISEREISEKSMNQLKERHLCKKCLKEHLDWKKS